MAKKMLIDATHAEETRIVVADGNFVEEFDFETASKRQLAGNIYLAKVTRVEPSLQAAFVDYGGNRHGFLAFAEIHPDYYQIPAADREALKAEERADAEADQAEDDANTGRGRQSSRRRSSSGRDGRGQADNSASRDGNGSDTAQAEASGQGDPTRRSEDIPGMAIAGESKGGDDQGNGDADSDSDDHDNGTEADIESLTQDDSDDEPRRARKPRARRYKIQEVIKARQIMLVQVVKEERGNKGAALTTYLSLAGRYCVLMPNTARGGGISRKITNAADRKKLKDIAADLEVPQGAGLIIRTAGSQRTRMEIRRDYEYLMRLWEQIRELTFKSVSPAPIYEEGDLIKRSIRDLYSREIDEVLVEGERGYRTARDFMAMIMPSHARNVKHYRDPMPLFSRYQVENYLGSMFNPVVQLKSGGYIVIGITEALVAIDVNSGRATKEGSIEETAYKTNCEAADEIARQLRLRDLAGLIVIDFIDMDERKHNAAVEKRFKDRLKSDRARIQVGRISGFGLLEMSRQRLRPGMLESITQPCNHCHGTGLIRSDDSLALTVLRAIEEEGTRKSSGEVLVRAPVPVVNFLINTKREHIAAIEARFGMAVRLEADPALISPDFTVEKFKTASRIVAQDKAGVISADAMLMAAIDEAADEGDASESPAAEVERGDDGPQAAVDRAASNGDEAGNGAPATGRRRRRRRRPARNGGAAGDQPNNAAAGKPRADEAARTDAADTDAREDKADSPAERGAGKDAAEPPAGKDAPVTASADRVTHDGKADAEGHVADKSDKDAEAKPARAAAARDVEPDAEGKSASASGDAPVPASADKPAKHHEAAPTVTATTSDRPAEAAEDGPAEAGDEEPEAAKVTAMPAPSDDDAKAEPQPAMADAADNDDDDGSDETRPKRRGWWSV